MTPMAGSLGSQHLLNQMLQARPPLAIALRDPAPGLFVAARSSLPAHTAAAPVFSRALSLQAAGASQQPEPGQLYGGPLAGVLGVALAAWALGPALTAFGDAAAQDLSEGLAAVTSALQAGWQEVEEEMARITARMPKHYPALQGSPPEARVVDGSLEVVVPIRKGAATVLVQNMLIASLGSLGDSHLKSHEYGTSRTTQLEVRPDRRDESKTIRAQMFVPPPGGSEAPQLVISKRSAFTPDELEAISRVVQVANLSFGGSGPSGASSSSASRHGLPEPDGFVTDLEEFLADVERISSIFGGFVGGPMRGAFQDFQRVMDELKGQEGPEGTSFPGGAEPGPDNVGRPKTALTQRGTLTVPPASKDTPEGHEWGSRQAEAAVQELQGMGAQVYPPGNKDKMDWGVLAGYEKQKRTIEDTLLLPLLRPEVYNKLARATRKTFESNRPRAVLFEGPPGTGKTTSARVISSQAAVPLVYLPLEAVVSKWYGESEQLLAKVFKAAEAMGGAIIFLDELDALGGNRESGGLHEASRRLLSVLLREIEGFDVNKKTVVIGATNRKDDLDAALLSRFDLIVTFPLPSKKERHAILKQYAQQLTDPEVEQVAERTAGMSGRDLRDVCEHTERRWASKIIRGEVPEDALPPVSEYLHSAEERQAALRSNTEPGMLNLHDYLPGRK